MDRTRRIPAAERWTLRIEGARALDGPVGFLEPHIRTAFGTGTRGAVLRGDWLGHPLHPALTDVVVGSWASATVLDVIGGRGSQVAARRLIGVGLAAVGPTAWSGWAQWTVSGPRQKRVGLVHALTNAAAIGTYAASWIARRRGRHGAGVALGLAGAGIMVGGAYLGGHLAAGREVADDSAAYDADVI